ncbi:MAG TPA: bifunctional DNA primase/polymerase [Sedimentisphaerales bacterium]|nr:bifunctional DNA primase/polymerase [Sedimentisphaerales bacterium]HRS10779.1 bifunctional DNA primase/polymerase [Sedimentisphaerales bacterium]HRV47484.1 bifunctional DNA primase/polymerase [Sedimentisphaerales bacterium]
MTTLARSVPTSQEAAALRLCDTAISYGDMYWRVLPLYGIIDGRCTCGNPDCTSPGKHPHGHFAPHGVKDASLDGNEICRWFGNGEVLNVGVATGPESGIVVLDVDKRHGGVESLKGLGDLPRTATVKTGGGWHYYFKCPEGVDIRNSAGKLGPGLDVRGAGGYVVAPPSMHASGVPYKWLVDPRGGLADLPRPILDRLTQRPKAATPVGDTIPVGSRDTTLTSLAGSMRRRGMTEAGILAALRIENGRCEEPLPDGDLQRIARSIGTRPAGETNVEMARPPITVVDAATWLTTEPPASDQILTDTFDAGDKVALIGPSKMRKSFFLLQGTLSIASGRDFLGWSVPKPRRVFLVQFEIQQHHFHRRVRRMAAALELTPEILEDRFQIVNGRGLALSGAAGIEAVKQAVLPFSPDLICIDPLYKISTGAENAAEDMKTVLGLFDQLAEQTGAAVLYVHHDAKGFSGDRDIRDRGSGSGVLGRDYDACFTLTPHATEDDAVVVETLLRNYRPQEACTIGWVNDLNGGYCFGPRPDLAATKKTSTNAKARDIVTDEACHAVAIELLRDAAMEIGDFKQAIREKTGLGRNRTDEFVRRALKQPECPFDIYETRGRGRHRKLVGLPEQIAKLRECGQ